MRKLVTITCLVIIVGCSSKMEVPKRNSVSAAPTTAQSSEQQNPYADEGKQIAWIDKGKDAIKAKLRDPDSASWRNVKFYAGGGVPIVCGEVNANNGFGGKSGFERFVAAGDKIDVLESEMRSPTDMTQVWDRFCH